MLAPGQLRVEHAEDAAHLALEPPDDIGDSLFGEDLVVPELSHHRADMGGLEQHPLNRSFH
jgi:hypothetical protein